MKTQMLTCSAVLLFLVSLTTVWGIESDPALLGYWSFENSIGQFAMDESPNHFDGQIINAHVVEGAFGRALQCTGQNSYALIPGPSQLDGSDELTVQAWVLWNEGGRYPNIVTGGRWSPGGFLVFVVDNSCHFRLGRPGHQASRPGDQWQEVSAPIATPFPTGKWVHLAATFKRPTITTYLNGKKVGNARWDYPLGFEGNIVLGKWGGQESHNGLIDEVKLYRRARTAEEIAADVAQSSKGRDSAGFTALKLEKAPVAASYQINTAAFEVDVLGRLSRIRDRKTDRELLDGSRPLAMIRKKMTWIPAMSCHKEGDLLIVEFMRGAGTLKLRIEPKGDYLRIAVAALEGADIEALTMAQFAVNCADAVHPMSGNASDGESAVCVRALNLATEVRVTGKPAVFSVQTTEKYGLTKGAIAIAAGPSKGTPDALKKVALDEASVPVSKLGGPWSMDAPENRGSYLFSQVTEDNIEEWIDVALRGGFSHVHFSSWWKSLGHYEPRPRDFPNGLDGMKECVRKIHAAGLKAGMHTLTGCVATNDPWVTPIPDPRLVADATYTLVEPMDETSTEIRVMEKPGNHDVVWSYSGNGNVMRIGQELIHYHEIRQEEPYAFFKLQRGAFKTVPQVHTKGVQVDHLQQRYLAFYPEENSTLVDEIADCIANVYNRCEMDQIYFDGSEGMRGWHPIAVMRNAIYNRLKRPALTEASCHGHHNWWFHSRLGAWDHAKWAPKRFQDLHCASAEGYRESALLEPQLGWWALIGPSRISRGQLPEEVEYFAAKNLSLNAAMSIQGVKVGSRPPNARQKEYFTLVGWYERLRLAGYFDDATRAALRTPGDEFRLRQAADGQWHFIPATFASRRVRSLEDGSSTWQTDNSYAPQVPEIRIEALYQPDPYDSTTGKLVTDFANEDVLRLRRTASGVTQTATVETGEIPGGTTCLRLQTLSKCEDRKGAWAQVGMQFTPYLNINGTDAIGAWIHGDGSGTLVNLQLRTPREHHQAIHENYVMVDFEGWRYVELPFREKSVDQFPHYKWPYGRSYSIYRNDLNRSFVNEFNVYLNNLPKGVKTDIRIGPVRALPIRKTQLRNPSIVINGATVRFPVSLESGHYIEGTNGRFAHFDERGELLAWIPAEGVLPQLTAEKNNLAFSAEPTEGANVRAGVTIMTTGKPFGTRNPDADIRWELLNREYDLPKTILKGQNSMNSWKVATRSGTTPDIELTLDILDVGENTDGYNAPDAITIDSCDDPAAFDLSQVNQYAQYAYDASTRGVPLKPGVEHRLELETKTVHEGSSSLRYTATSKRDDNAGWSAKGRKFSPPLDLSTGAGLGFWLYGDASNESFKVQLRDTEGMWHDMVTRVNFSGWRYIEFEWTDLRLDPAKIEYLIFYYNGIPAKQTVCCLIDDVKVITETAYLSNPGISVNGKTITVACELRKKQSLRYRKEAWTIVSPNGKKLIHLPEAASLPHLKSGTNTIEISFPEHAQEPMRVMADVVKLY